MDPVPGRLGRDYCISILLWDQYIVTGKRNVSYSISSIFDFVQKEAEEIQKRV